MSVLDEAAREAILAHMNTDHRDDGLMIVRAHGAPGAETAEMIDIDDATGTWAVTDGDGSASLVVVTWPEPLTSRRSARQQIVTVHDQAVRQAHGQ